jgi:hypothetical protein
MSGKLLVSVVVANYNYGLYLGMCLDSVLEQTYPRLEIVVVDDGSTDDSLRVLDGYRDRVRVLRQPNQGQAAALSTGVAASSGEILCLLDADDVWAPTKVARVAAVLEADERLGWLRHKLAVVNAGLEPLGVHVPLFRGSGRTPRDARYYLEGVVTAPTSALVLRRWFAEQAVPIPREIAGGGGGGAVQLVRDADAYLVARAGAALVPGYSLDEILGSYRRHARQHFAVTFEPVSLLQRQIEVARGVAAAGWGAGLAGRLPSSVYKHRLILQALEGEPRFGRARLGSAAAGLRQLVRLLPSLPRLFARQVTALLLALVAPDRWLRRLGHAQGFVTERSPDGGA